MKLYRGKGVHGAHRGSVVSAVYNRTEYSEEVPVIDGTEMCIFKIRGQRNWTIGPLRDWPTNKHLDFDGGPRLRLAVVKLNLMKD